MRHELVQVGAQRLRVATTGTGPPLLLIMGMGGNIETWGDLPAALLPGRTIICVDHPGMGQSPAPLWPIPMPALADLYAALLDRLGHHAPVDVLGYSFGGAVAQELAHRHPARVDRLALVATLPGVGSVPVAPWRTLLPLVRQVALAARGRGPLGIGPPPTLLGIAYQALAVCTWSSLPYLRTIPHDTLVLAGDADVLVHPANARLLAARIPNARLHLLAGAGHLLLAERTAAAGRIIRDFTRSSVPVEDVG